MQRTVVDFPDPEGPIMTNFSPSATSRLTSFKTCKSPKNLLIWSSLIIAIPKYLFILKVYLNEFSIYSQNEGGALCKK